LNYRILALLIVCIAQSCLIHGVAAVVKVELPVATRYKFSRSVVIGQVTGVNPGMGVVEVTTSQNLKGEAAPKFRIQILKPQELIKSVAVGQPVVVFSKETASIQIADTWLSAELFPGKEPPVWRATQEDLQAKPSFPGTTAALVRVLQEMKAGKSTLLDAFEGKLFTGGAKEIAKLDVAKPTFLLSVDVNGDGKPGLIVGSAQGVKLFLATADTYTDATAKWGLAGAAGSSASAGDVNGNGKSSLLIDKTLYLNDGQKFTAAPQAFAIDGSAPVMASALAKITGGNHADAALLLSDGRLLVFKNGSPLGAWTKEVDRKLIASGAAPQAAVFGDFAGDGRLAVMVAQDNSLMRFVVKGDTPPADFGRLTGDALEKIKALAGGLKNAVLTGIDVNGDHRPDLLLTCDGASVVLINRGFGMYLVDAEAAREFNAAGGNGLPFPLNAIRARCAVNSNPDRPEDLLVLSDDGRLFLVGNPSNKK
jgi:hypothetical protein